MDLETHAANLAAEVAAHHREAQKKGVEMELSFGGILDLHWAPSHSYLLASAPDGSQQTVIPFQADEEVEAIALQLARRCMDLD